MRSTAKRFNHQLAMRMSPPNFGLRPGLGDFGQGLLFLFFFWLASKVVFGQTVAEEVECVFGSVDEFKQVQVLGSNGASFDEGLEVHDAMPIFAAVDDDQNFFGEFVSLGESENLEEFIDGSESAGKNYQRFGEVGEPELAHEKIVKLEVERESDVGIGLLLKGKINVEANVLASGLVSSKVGGLHDARASAGGNDKAVAAGGDLN